MATALVDQDCQTKASKAKFFITALGELMRTSGVTLDSSSVRLDEIARKHGLDWNKVCLYSHDDASPEAVHWRGLIDAEFKAKRDKELSTVESAFVDKVYALQSAVEDGRFRVYGEIRNDDTECVVLVTEFCDFTDNADFWAKLAEIVATLDAHVWFMREEEHNNRYYPAQGIDGERESDVPVPGRTDGAKWIDGPGHGRMERQVELSWRIENQDVATVKAMRDKIVAVTDPIWPTAGVGVI